MHPHEHRLTRRNLMRGALGAGAAMGVGRRRRRLRRTRRPRSAAARAAATPRCSRLVVAEADRARSGCRCRAPTTASPGRSRTTTRRSRTASKPEGGDLNIFNYADYIWPGPRQALREGVRLQGQDRDLRTPSDEAAAKLSAGAVDFDVDHGPERQPDGEVHRAAADAAAQPQLPAEPREEHLARAAGSVLRPRLALHRPVRRLDGRHRLAQRQDRQRHRRHEGALGHLLGVAGSGGARSASSTTSATRSAMPMQRDAMRAGVRPDLNTDDAGDHRQGGPRPRASSRASATSR